MQENPWKDISHVNKCNFRSDLHSDLYFWRSKNIHFYDLKSFILKMHAKLNSESKKTFKRTYHKPITVTLILASIMTSNFRSQNYVHLPLFFLNHLPNMKRSDMNQNYETLNIENIITYISYNLHQTSIFLEVIMIKTHCRLKLSAKFNSECKKTFERTYQMAKNATLALTSSLTSIFGGQQNFYWSQCGFYYFVLM